MMCTKILPWLESKKSGAKRARKMALYEDFLNHVTLASQQQLTVFLRLSLL